MPQDSPTTKATMKTTGSGDRPPALDRSPSRLAFGLVVAGLALLLLAVAAFVGLGVQRQSHRRMQAAVLEFEDRGYEVVWGRGTLVIREPLTRPHVLAADRVSLQADAEANLAILAPTAEIRSRVRGDLDFRGQVLTIQPEGVVEGALDGDVQIIDLRGRIWGEIRARYQFLDETQAAPSEEP